MEFKTTVFLGLILTVAASGCIDTDSQEEKDLNKTADETKEVIDWASCEDVRIQIDQASSTAMIRQMNERPVGEVTLNWRFENGDSASETVNLSRKGQVKFVKSGNTGKVEQLEVIPSRCPDRVFRSE